MISELDLALPGWEAPGEAARRSVGAGALTLLVVAAALVVALPLVGHLAGYRTMVVAGGSMAPYARAGDALVLQSVGPEGIRPGDVITFRPLRSRALVTHRVLRRLDIEGTVHFQTRGDANGGPDADLVPAPNVVGAVSFRAPGLGWFYGVVASTPGRMLLIVVPALWLAWGELRALRPRRRRRRGPAKVRLGLASATLAVGLVLGLGAPAAGLFAETNAVGTNGFVTGTVNAPTLNSATYTSGLLNCRITLNWTPPGAGVSPDGYDIYRSTTSGGPYSFIQHVGTQTGYIDSGLAILTTYYYVLRSTRSSWRSGNSNQRSASTPLLCT